MNSDKKNEIDRIRTSGDNEVAAYLEVASSKEVDPVHLDVPNSPETIIVIDLALVFIGLYIIKQ